MKTLTRSEKSLLLKTAKTAARSVARGRVSNTRCDRVARDLVRETVATFQTFPFLALCSLILGGVGRAIAELV